jgi:hypothetical protein
MITAAAALSAATLVACSLLYRPSDYFDPAGQVTAIGSTSDNATAIVLTSSLLVYATSTGIYSLPKSGGNVATLTTFSKDNLTAIASNGTDLVAWCGAMGVRVWRPGWANAQTIDTPVGCASIDAQGESVAAVTQVAPDASVPSYQVVVYRAGDLGFEVDLEGGVTLPSKPSSPGNERVSLTRDGLYFVSGDLIGRKRRPDEISKRRPNAPCDLAVGGGTTVDFRVIALEAGPEGNDAGVLVYYRGTKAFRLGHSQDTCCLLGDAGQGRCPDLKLFENASYQAVALHEPYVYYLPNNELLRASVSDPEDASTVRAGWGDVVGSLAIDDDYAYFAVDNRILRLALSP